MRAVLTLALAATALTVPAAAQDTGPSATGGCAVVSILPGAIPVVEVKIGGKGPYRFGIDTGAQGYGRISPELAEELGLPKVGEVGTPAPGGTVATRPVYGASEISVGGVSFKNLDLVALSTVLTPELVREGAARDFIRQVQQLRKDHDLDENEQIVIACAPAGGALEELRQALRFASAAAAGPSWPPSSSASWPASRRSRLWPRRRCSARSRVRRAWTMSSRSATTRMPA